MTLTLGSKAETLLRVSQELSGANVLPMRFFDRARWVTDPDGVLEDVSERVSDRVVIVRSSAVGEDARVGSQAGRYLSVPHVPSGDRPRLRDAIDRVFASYEGDSDGDQVLVQVQLLDLVTAGVVFTTDLDTLAPYFVVSYASSHDAVTSGRSEEQRTYVRFRGASEPYPEPWIEGVLNLAKDLERLTGESHLDLEFGVSEDGTVHLFQARPIVSTGPSAGSISEADLAHHLQTISNKIGQLALDHPDLAGDGTMFGVMPDWNPAEIIGMRPRPLALSLYRELVTDSIWAYQRSNYGYRNLRSFPLVVSLYGLPYIDVRVSFNSLIPQSIRHGLAEKLVNYYMACLSERPSDHDKVEFNILFTCAYPGVEERLKVLLDHGFSEREVDRIQFALLEVTNEMVGRLAGDLARVQKLEARHADLMASRMPTAQRVYWLVEDCKRYGTLPFVGLARAGFVAVQFLHALRKRLGARGSGWPSGRKYRSKASSYLLDKMS